MSLDLFNNLFNHAKENNFIQNFIKELSEVIEKSNNGISNKRTDDNLKQEDCLYQVIEIDADGAYLQNTSNNKISKENDIPKEILDKIGNDSVLRYKDGKYIFEESITNQFLDSLVDIAKYQEIKDKFVNESNILEIDSNTRYKLQSKKQDSCILTYGQDEKNNIQVPKELIPFWTSIGENLYYKNGKFNRDL